MKKIVAFAGSNSSRSINKQLVGYAVKQLHDYDISLLDLNDYEMPCYSLDRERETGIPELAQQFRAKLAEADGIICSLAEHNNSYSAAFKNILDWCSRVDMDIFKNKPMLLMSTSPGGYGGGNVMQAATKFFPKCKATIIETFSLPSFKDNFNEGAITNEEIRETLFEKIKAFEKALV